MQPAFFWEFGDGYIVNYGRRRRLDVPCEEPARNWRVVAGSSDAPVTHYPPLFGIEQALTRATSNGDACGPTNGSTWPRRSACTRSTAPSARSKRTARAQSNPAKFADLVVLTEDLRPCAARTPRPAGREDRRRRGRRLRGLDVDRARASAVVGACPDGAARGGRSPRAGRGWAPPPRGARSRVAERVPVDSHPGHAPTTALARGGCDSNDTCLRRDSEGPVALALGFLSRRYARVVAARSRSSRVRLRWRPQR